MADIFQVVVLSSYTDAFLAGGGAVVVSFRLTEKNIFKLVHSSVGEKEGRIVMRHDRGGRDDRMPLILKVLQKFAANLARVHIWLKS